LKPAQDAVRRAPAPPSVDPGRRGIYLHPGHVFAAAEPSSVTTILGSCVAVCLFDRERTVGGISHFVLPSPGGGAISSARFADVALRDLVARVLALGAQRADLEAKVFGGASVLEHGPSERRRLGDENVREAVALLESEGTPIVARDTGGTRGRKLIFHTDTGTAWVKHL
jgi:chemotaxis protein CheD